MCGLFFARGMFLMVLPQRLMPELQIVNCFLVISGGDVRQITPRVIPSGRHD